MIKRQSIMKKACSTLLVLCMIFAISVSAFAASNSGFDGKYEIGKPATITQGEEFTVTIGLKNLANAELTCDYCFYFDSEYLRLVSYSYLEGDDDGFCVFDNYMQENAQVNISIIVDSYCNRDYVELVALTFMPLKSGSTDIEIETHSFDLNKVSMKLPGCVDLEILPAPESSDKTDNGNSDSDTNDTNDTGEYLGDVDGNGKITAADARTILRHSASLEKISDEYIHLADINSDGKITSADARIALRMSAGLDSKFKYGETYHEHVYKVTDSKTATCISAGYETKVCTVCGDKKTSTVKAVGHQYSAATCSAPATCKVCGVTTGTTTGHKFVNGACSCGLTVSQISNLASKLNVAVEVLLMGANIGTDALNANDYKTYIATIYASYIADGGLFKEAIELCGNIPEFANIKANLQNATNIATSAYNSLAKNSSGKIIVNSSNAYKLVAAEIESMKCINAALSDMNAILKKYNLS